MTFIVMNTTQQNKYNVKTTHTPEKLKKKNNTTRNELIFLHFVESTSDAFNTFLQHEHVLNHLD